jgi:hypothetical protein
MKTLIISTIALMTLAAPAFAAHRFYISQDLTSKACSVSHTKPDGKLAMQMGHRSFKSMKSATVALKADKGCK